MACGGKICIEGEDYGIYVRAMLPARKVLSILR